MQIKKRILYFYPHRSSFIVKDLKALSDDFEVLECPFPIPFKMSLFYQIIKQKFFLLRYAGKAEIMISFFGGYHSLIPGFFAFILRKPFLLIVGGTECVSYPSINYGNLSKRILGLATRFSFKWATHISPVHESLIYSEDTFYRKDYTHQGYAFHIKRLIEKPATTIYLGFEKEIFYKAAEKERNSFLTVAAGLDSKRMMDLKGINLIIDIAPFFPECKFYIIGIPKEKLFAAKSENIIQLPNLPLKELIIYFSRSEYYLQLSVSEGFPSAIAEAMLCECIPIGSNIGAIPLIIGETGFILEKSDKQELQKLISVALSADRQTLGKLARIRISEEFPQQKRNKQLVKLVFQLLDEKYFHKKKNSSNSMII